jgi:phospholipase/carboxylesterase
VRDLELLEYMERPPAGETAGALVLMHGRGASETDLFPLLDMLDPEQRLWGFAPRGPLRLPPGGAHWYALGGIPTPNPDTFLDVYPRVDRWLRAVAEETGVAPERTVLGGFSQGAVMSWALGLGEGRPRPAGIVAMSGFMPRVEGWSMSFDAPLPRAAILHGTYDETIRVEWGREAKETLEAAGADVLYRESALAHSIDPRVLTELQAWLLETLP